MLTWTFRAEEVFDIKRDGHKFQIGQEVRPVGMEDNPEFNGRTITITNYRTPGQYGRAYYFKAADDIQTELNWIYEFRLEALDAVGE